MKTRLFLFVITLIGITLACSLHPNEEESLFSHTEVRSVAVNPSMGAGSFTLTVTYTVYLGTDRLPEAITCYYVTPAGATLPIGSVSPPITVTGERILDGTQTLSMSASDPGVYTATCKTTDSKASAVFGVTDPPSQSQTEPVPPTAPTPTATLTPSPTPTSEPITVTGTGRYIFSLAELATDRSNACDAVPASFSLTVESDGTAQLSVTTTWRESDYSDSIKIYSCVFQSNTGTVTYVGSVNATEGEKTVSIYKTKSERPCVGKFSYAEGVLSGGMICQYMGTSKENFSVP